jgi:hypothetical protein
VRLHNEKGNRWVEIAQALGKYFRPNLDPTTPSKTTTTPNCGKDSAKSTPPSSSTFTHIKLSRTTSSPKLYKLLRNPSPATHP